MNVGVLASGAGTNLQALIDRAHGRDGVVIVAVASDKPEARALDARARGRASTPRFPARARSRDRAERDAAMAAWLRERGVELVVLAGYMQLLSDDVPGRLPGPRDQRASRRCCRRSRAWARCSRRSTTASRCSA